MEPSFDEPIRGSEEVRSAYQSFHPPGTNRPCWSWPHRAAVRLSILISGVLLANARGAVEVTSLLANRLFGEKAPSSSNSSEQPFAVSLRGILGVVAIQSVLAGLGVLSGEIAWGGLWAVVFLVAAVLQVGALVLIPAVI